MKKTINILLVLMFFHFISHAQSASSSRGPYKNCGSYSGTLVVDDSLMISYRMLKGADNYSLSLRKYPNGKWTRPTGDVYSGCSRLGYFVIHFRHRPPNSCENFTFEPGNYEYRIWAYRDSVDCIGACAIDSCMMEGEFNLTAKHLWQSRAR